TPTSPGRSHRSRPCASAAPWRGLTALTLSTAARHRSPADRAGLSRTLLAGGGAASGACAGASGRQSPEAHPSADPSSAKRRASCSATASGGGSGWGGRRTLVRRTSGAGSVTRESGVAPAGAGVGAGTGAAGRAVARDGRAGWAGAGRSDAKVRGAGATSLRSGLRLRGTLAAVEALGEPIHLGEQLGDAAGRRELDGLEQGHLQREP